MNQVETDLPIDGDRTSQVIVTCGGAALRYANMGLRVVPLWGVASGVCECPKGSACPSAGKHPRVPGWQKAASADPAVVADWWARWPAGNVGLAMGGPARVVALDIDGASGRASLAALEAEHGPLPATWTSRSGRPDGGEHRLFRVPDELDLSRLRNSVKVRDGLDVRVTGGQIVAPPSVHRSGAAYRWIASPDDGPPAELPEWLYRLLTEPRERKPRAAEPRERKPRAAEPAGREAIPLADRIKRASAYLERCAPAISGEEGHTTTFRTAMHIGPGFALPEDVCFDLLWSEYNPRCQPPWSEAELRRKVREAYKGGMPWGAHLEERDRRAPRAARRADEPANDVGDDARPEIELGPELHDIVDQAVAALRSDPTLYQREGILVHVVRTQVDLSEDGTFIPAGTPQIRPIALATLRERMTRAARWVRLDKRSDKLVRVMPPDDVVHAVLARGSWRGIRPLIGIIEAPSMRPDGSLIDKPGYDPATGYLYAPSRAFPPIPEAPTQEDARRALAELEDVFVDFPHRSKDHRATAIAAILTLLGRPAIRGNIPAVLWESTTPGTGKGLGADVVGIVGTGRPTAKLNFPDDDVELDKVLAGCALDGTALVNFDNIPTKLAFGGGTLDRCLTCGGRVQLRVLGKSGNPTLPWVTMVMATGNNIFIRDDMARRCIVSSLETHLENPEERQNFKHPDLLAWVTAERPRLVCAALTILRAFIVAGRPRMGLGTWGSFEQWAALVPPAIVFAGGGNPMRTRPTVESRSDPEKDAMRVILRDLPRLDVDGLGMTAKSVIGCLYPIERLRGIIMRPDGFDEMREAIEALVPTKPGSAPDTRAFGKVLAKFKGRVIGGVHLRPMSTQGGVMKWRVVEARPANVEIDVEREAIQAEGRKLGPNGCAVEGCACTPCATCGGCRATMNPWGKKALDPEQGGCRCLGPNGCGEFLDCDCKPCRRCGGCSKHPCSGGGCAC